MRLARVDRKQRHQVVLTGASSVEAYAVMAREPMQSFYCTDIDKAITKPRRRHPRNGPVCEREPSGDAGRLRLLRPQAGLVASPIQSYLELMNRRQARAGDGGSGAAGDPRTAGPRYRERSASCMDALTASLLDLLHELEGRRIPITVGGGFGLYLKRQHLAATGERTLFDQLPEPRSTNDLDLFLRTEVLVDLERTREVVEAIRRLGYIVVDAAKFLQWKREIDVAGVPQEVKMDVLVGPLGDARNDLHVSMPRVRPQGEDRVPRPRTKRPSALRTNQSGPRHRKPLDRRAVHGNSQHSAGVPLPDDEIPRVRRPKEQAAGNMGRHHVLDLYTIVGMMTEKEYERAKELGIAHARTST